MIAASAGSTFASRASPLVAALIGSKLAVLVGDGLWPLQPFHEWVDLLISGRSIVGALLFGFVVAEASKPLLGYTLPPNDRFAVILPFSIATGRIGCWLSGCCLGVEMDGFPGMCGLDGVRRFRAPLVEMLFHLGAGLTLLILLRRKQLVGRLFAVLLVAYRGVPPWLGILAGGGQGVRRPVRLPMAVLVMVVAGGIALYQRREGRASATGSPTLEPA